MRRAALLGVCVTVPAAQLSPAAALSPPTPWGPRWSPPRPPRRRWCRRHPPHRQAAHTQRARRHRRRHRSDRGGVLYRTGRREAAHQAQRICVPGARGGNDRIPRHGATSHGGQHKPRSTTRPGSRAADHRLREPRLTRPGPVLGHTRLGVLQDGPTVHSDHRGRRPHSFPRQDDPRRDPDQHHHPAAGANTTDLLPRYGQASQLRRRNDGLR